MQSILIVDDVEVNRAVLRAAVEQRFLVYEACNGKEALDILYKNGKEIEAILLDLMMPVMDGFDFMRIVKKNPLLREIPIVVTTEAEGADNELKALNLGADEFLTKPFHVEIIAKRVNNIVRNHFLERQMEGRKKERRRDLFVALSSVYSEVFELNYTDDVSSEIYRTQVTADFLRSIGTVSEGYKQIMKYVIHPEDAAKYESLFSKKGIRESFGKENGECHFIEVRLKQADGSYRWSSTGLIRVSDNQGKDVFLACTKDISEMKEAQRVLKEHHELKLKESKEIGMRRVLSHMPVGVGIYEITDKVRREYMNDRLCQIFKIPEGRKDLMQELDMLHLPLEEIREGKIKLNQRLIRKVKAKHYDGSEFWLRMVYRLRVNQEGKLFCHCVMSDATQEVRLRETYERQTELYKMVLEDLKDQIFEYDVEKDTLFFYNGLKVRGKEQDVIHHYVENMGENTNILEEYKGYILKNIKRACKHPTYGEFDYKAAYGSGEIHWYRAQYRSIQGKGNVVRIIGRIKEITEEKQLTNQLLKARTVHERLKSTAFTDTVTGLLNRYAFQRGMEQMLEGKNKEIVSAFMICDLDNFKKVNDSKGHQMGDWVLREFANSLKKIFSEHDVIGRLGGDEFVICICNEGTKNLQEGEHGKS